MRHEEAVFDRPLPSAVDVEKLVLGAMILYPLESVPVALDYLEIGDFFNPDNRKVFERIRQLSIDGEEIRLLTVGMAMKKYADLPDDEIASALLSLTEGVPKIYNLDTRCESIREKARLRSAILAFSAAATRLMNPAAGLEAIREEQARIADLNAESGGKESGFVWISEVIENTDAGGFEAFIKPGANESGIPWPLQSLTDATGGFTTGNVTVLGAGTGKGKTTLATQCALYAAKLGYTVAILSAEMTRLEVSKKIVAQHGRRCLSDWLTGDIGRDDRRVLAESAVAVHPMRIAIDDRSDVTPGMLDSALSRLGKKSKVHLLIVDYIQLLDSGMKSDGETREQHVAHVSRAIKKLTKKHNLAALVLTQLNDDGKTRESRAIKQDASNALILADKGFGNYEATLEKGRFSANRKIPLFFDGANGLFSEVENR